MHLFDHASVADERTHQAAAFHDVFEIAADMHSLQLGEGLPYIGWLLGWASVGLSLASLVLASRQVLRVSTGRAVVICSIALGAPLALFWL